MLTEKYNGILSGVGVESTHFGHCVYSSRELRFEGLKFEFGCILLVKLWLETSYALTGMLRLDMQYVQCIADPRFAKARGLAPVVIVASGFSLN